MNHLGQQVKGENLYIMTCILKYLSPSVVMDTESWLSKTSPVGVTEAIVRAIWLMVGILVNGILSRLSDPEDN
jgi:hypothetical protein